jgi:hypothetical protein
MPSDYKDTGSESETGEAAEPALSGTGLSDAGIQAMQGETTEPTESQLEPEPTQVPEPPPEHRPKLAIGERGLAERVETGPEKTEKEVFYGSGPERLG